MSLILRIKSKDDIDNILKRYREKLAENAVSSYLSEDEEEKQSFEQSLQRLDVKEVIISLKDLFDYIETYKNNIRTNEKEKWIEAIAPLAKKLGFVYSED